MSARAETLGLVLIAVVILVFTLARLWLAGVALK
jgi:hypothetical protein